MILENIISHLNGKLVDLNYFSARYGLSELKKVDDKESPYIYCGVGEYKKLSNIDFEKGLSYWRKRDDVSISAVENTLVGCENFIKITFKLKLIGFVKLLTDTKDTNYTSDIISIGILTALNTNSDTVLKRDIKSRNVKVLSKGYSTNAKSIIDSEFKGFDLDNKPNSFSVISHDIDVELSISQSCLTAECLKN